MCNAILNVEDTLLLDEQIINDDEDQIMTLAEAKTRWEEMHFHHDIALYDVQRACKTRSEANIAEAVMHLCSWREGLPMSDGGTYPRDYFGELADFIYHSSGQLHHFID